MTKIGEIAVDFVHCKQGFVQRMCWPYPCFVFSVFPYLLHSAVQSLYHEKCVQTAEVQHKSFPSIFRLKSQVQKLKKNLWPTEPLNRQFQEQVRPLL